ncbi:MULTISPECIES: nucleotide-binding domain-containing protein [Bacillus amyloliquefaciens group]|uniref:nucleotide-binding domain-containing protein n=1 Tax=Bacillus amyloliquefaciens group TaxID=1938374 RepID=UPI000A8ADC40|nr:nucleotidyltransferase [Bacillus velezensis]
MMYDLSGKFNTFYNNHVVLKREQKTDLHEKKDINIKRLKDGLQAYNDENGTDYKLAEDPVVQGSVTMHTVTQNDSNDYDIDVAIVFEKDGIPDGTIAAKRVVEKALLKKCTGFKEEPKAHTNCVRVVYKDGYHIDFAVYRRYKENESDTEYIYEHCGSEWRERDPRKITKWFISQNRDVHDLKLREIVRLLKMFCKSRSSWSMPGGLIQSVLADESCFSDYARMDERFYYTLYAIKNRLKENKEVYNPTDTSKSLTYTEKDESKVQNLYNRLTTYLEKLSVLFDDKCSKKDALKAWCDFFDHSYWAGELNSENVRSVYGVSKSYTAADEVQPYNVFRETEEFIEHQFPINIKFETKLGAAIVKNDKQIGILDDYLKREEKLDKNLSLYFKVRTSASEPYEVYWKVKNRGDAAERVDQIRGEIFKGLYPEKTFHQESTSFSGNHYVECYIIKNGECVGKSRIKVPIV